MTGLNGANTDSACYAVAGLPFSRVAVFGVNGQVGSALMALLADKAIGFGREQCDLSQPEAVTAALDACQPDAVINAAAYTAVDLAEQQREAAMAVNAHAPAAMAQWCARYHVPFIHYSTDYVFDGSGHAPWREEDMTAPLNAYGESKLAGEQAVGASGAPYLIFRTSWVYDGTGKNFLNTMLRLGRERETLSVVADQSGAPCYAPDLARYTLQALERAAVAEQFPSGIYHMAHGGETSWQGFAEQIFAGARERGENLLIKMVEPIPSSAYPTPAKRPLNSRLDCSRLQAVFGITLPHWQQGLTQALESIYHASHHLPT